MAFSLAAEANYLTRSFFEGRVFYARALHYFESGYHCAEVVSKTVMEQYLHVPNDQVLRAASGFGGGIAGTMTELCGAFTGGVLTLGALFGRQRPGDDLGQCGTLITAFKNYFQDEHGSLNCPTIINSLNPDEVPLGCARLTASATVMLLEMLKEFETQMAGPPMPPKSNYLPDNKDVQRCPFTSSHHPMTI